MTQTLPVVGNILQQHLKSVPEINSLVSGRVWQDLHTNPQFPAIVIMRWGGAADWPTWIDRASVQIDFWGRTKAEIDALAQMSRAALADLSGQVSTEGVVLSVSEVRFGYEPDTTFSPAKPRNVLDARVVVHP